MRWDSLRNSVGLTKNGTILAGYRYRLTCRLPDNEGGGPQILAQTAKVGGSARGFQVAVGSKHAADISNNHMHAPCTTGPR